MKRKLLTILTALALCLSLCPVPALALEPETREESQEQPREESQEESQEQPQEESREEPQEQPQPEPREAPENGGTFTGTNTGTGQGFAAISAGSGLTLGDLLPDSGYVIYKGGGTAVNLAGSTTGPGTFTVDKAPLDLSGAASDVTDQWDSQGYKWEHVRTDPADPGKIISGTLTLADGFRAKKLILPDAAVTIVTNGEGSIGTLTPPETPGGGAGAYNMRLTFSGEGTLTVRDHIEISGGNDNRLTVSEKAALVAGNGISIGASGVDGLITVAGTLIVEQGAGISAIYAGRVTVNTTGALEVSGTHGVYLAGTDSGQDFRDLFTVEEDGRFTANCSGSGDSYTVMVQSSGSFPEGTSPQGAIPLSPEYLPENCEARLSGGGSAIYLIDTTTGKPYTGDITIHKNHIWSPDWSDENGHWHGCVYAGCGKQEPGSYTAHSLGDWREDAAEHWRGCAVCGTGRWA